MSHKKLLTALFIVIVSSTLTACASQTKPLKPHVPQNLLIKCDNLRSLESGTLGELLTWTVETSEKYAECSAKLNAWIEIWHSIK